MIQLKKIVLALSLGMMIGSTATVVAATNETVQATIAKFTVKFNGEEKEIKNPIVVIDGTSYLPLRDVSDLFGYHVDYEDSTRTITVDQKRGDSPYEVITPNMSEWTNVLDIISFLKANDVKASVEGDSSMTHLDFGVHGFGFPLPFEEQYKDTDIAKLFKRSKDSSFPLLVFNKNLYVNNAEIKELGIPVPEEWLLLTDLQKPSAEFDFTALTGVKKLTPVYLTTDKGIIRAMNSSKGILLNKEDLKAREIVK
jgi:hypothetical protein